MKTDSSPDEAVIRAAGGVVWRRDGGPPRLCLVHRPKYRDWSLPKGKLKAGETWLEAARREVREETGCEVEIGDPAGTLRYPVKGRLKVVRFWHMERLSAGSFRPSEEVDRVEWLTPAEARQRLRRPAERELLLAAGVPNARSERPASG